MRGLPHHLRKIGIIAGAVGLALVVAQHGAATALAARDPALVLQFQPGNARALARRSESLLTPDATPKAVKAAIALSRASLTVDSTNVVAARTYGFAIEADRPRDAATILRLAHNMSRRDIPTQLWMNDYAARRGDARAALRHYDAALRTSPSAMGVLAPILIASIDDAGRIEPLAELLAQRPAWSDDFLSSLVENGRDTRHVFKFAQSLSRRRAPLPLPILEQFVRRLVREGKYADAKAAYLLSGLATRIVSNGDLEGPGGDVPFQWQFSSEGGHSAGIGEQPGRGRVLSFEADPAERAILARQLIVLPGRRYRLSYDHAVTAPGIDWEIRCATDERLLASAPVPAGGNSSSGLPFSVECPAQWLMLTSGAGGGADIVSGWVDNIAITAEP